MAAGSFTLYDSAAKIGLGGMDLTSATVVVTLHSSTYTPNQVTHTARADLTNQLATANGYTQDSKTIASPVLTAITNGYKFSSANPSWTASGGSIPAWRYAVFSITGTVEGITNPLIGYFLGDSTPADVPATTDTNTLTLTCPANGWFDLTRP